jgi:hypothetical protein
MDDFTPQLRVAVALVPFVVAFALRVIFGRRVWTRWCVTIATMWFAMNILLAPYSAGIRRQILSLGSSFR